MIPEKEPKESLIGFMSNKVKSGGGINLAQGLPGFPPPATLLDELHQLTYDNIHQYAPGNGNARLVKCLQNHYAEASVNEDELLVVQGATEAAALIFTYLNRILPENKSCLAFDPAYETYQQLPQIHNRQYHSFDLNNNLDIDFDALRDFIWDKNTGIIFINSPGNPLGKVWTKEEFDQLLHICEKHGIYLIIDAVYRELVFEKSYKAYIPIDRMNKRVFYLNSLSKLLSITGWRIGYLICHSDHMMHIRNIHDYTGLCASSILQEAAARYLEKSDFGKDYVLELRQKIASNLLLAQKALKKLGFEIPKIEGGYFIWCRLPDGFTNGYTFSIDLYEKTKVAVVPGIHFSEKAGNFIRINIAREKEEIERALEAIRGYISRKAK